MPTLPIEVNHTAVTVAARASSTSSAASGRTAGQNEQVAPPLPLHAEEKALASSCPTPRPPGARWASVGKGKRLYAVGRRESRTRECARSRSTTSSASAGAAARDADRPQPRRRGAARRAAVRHRRSARARSTAARSRWRATRSPRANGAPSRRSTSREAATPRSPTGGALVAFGGEELIPGGETIEEVELFDPAADDWSPLPEMVTPRHGLGGVAKGDRVFALEGGPQPGLDALARARVPRRALAVTPRRRRRAARAQRAGARDHDEGDRQHLPGGEALVEQRGSRRSPRPRARGSSAPRRCPAAAVAAPRARASRGSPSSAPRRRGRSPAARGSVSSPPPSTIPTGRTTSVATAIARARPVPPAKVRPTRAESRM